MKTVNVAPPKATSSDGTEAKCRKVLRSSESSRPATPETSREMSPAVSIRKSKPKQRRKPISMVGALRSPMSVQELEKMSSPETRTVNLLVQRPLDVEMRRASLASKAPAVSSIYLGSYLMTVLR